MRIRIKDTNICDGCTKKNCSNNDVIEKMLSLNSDLKDIPALLNYFSMVLLINKWMKDILTYHLEWIQ